MKKINSPVKSIKQSHTSKSKIGMGDFLGQAVKQKVGRAQDIMLEKPMTKKQMKSPPKSLA